MTLFEHFTFGPLRVIVDAETGRVAAVQDALTGCAAALLYCRADILEASRLAQLAWQSTAELV